jgi:hypothetical protein
VIFHETRHHTQAHVISGTLCALSLATRQTDGSAVGFAGRCLLRRLLLRLAVVVAAVVPLLLLLLLPQTSL